MKPIASIVVEACYIYKVHTIQGHRKFQQPSLRILCRCKVKHQLLVKKNKSLSNTLLVFCTASIESSCPSAGWMAGSNGNNANSASVEVEVEVKVEVEVEAELGNRNVMK